MQRQYVSWFLCVILSTIVGCVGKTKSRPEPGTVEAVIDDCRREQQVYHQMMGKKQSYQNEENEIIRNRVFEGVPHFDFQKCVERNMESHVIRNSGRK